MKKSPENVLGGGITFKLQCAVGFLTGLLTFLLPIKLAGLAVMPEATSFFPPDWIDYLYTSWPAHSFGILSGVLLLATLAAFPSEPPHKSVAGRTALLWAFGLPLAALPGFLHVDTLDYAVGMVFHLAGVGAYIWSISLILQHRPEWRRWYLTAIAAGALYVGYAGLHQYFIGFSQTREYMLGQMREGIQISEVMLAKLDDTRVYATFVSCNALAGYLVLILPLAGLMFWRAGNRFEPQKVSQPLLAGVIVLILGAVLLLSRGRGALLAALVAAGGFTLSLPLRRWQKVTLAAGALAVLIAGAVYVHHSARGYGSIEQRVDYLRTSWQMMQEKPLAGHGWGGFFYRHMELKTAGTDEAAHDPHNLLAAFVTQAGVPAGLAVLIILGYPMTVLGLRVFRRRADAVQQALFWGETAFLLHAMMDVDLQIPANMALAGGLLVAAFIPGERDENRNSCEDIPGRNRIAWAIPAVLLAVAAIVGNWHILRGEVAFDRLSTLVRPQSVRERTPATPVRVEALLEEAVAAKPYSPFAWETAGDYFLERRNYRLAEKYFLEAQKRTASRPSVYGRLHRIEKARGNEARARELLLEMHRRFPSHPRYRQMVEEAYPDFFE